MPAKRDIKDPPVLEPIHYDDAKIRRILNKVRTIAMVGASPTWNRPSFFAMKYLQAKGYRVIPINPRAAANEAFQLGLTAIEAGDIETARAHFERVTQLDPEDSGAWFNLGLCRMQLHDEAGARQAFERALALQPGNQKYRDAVAPFEAGASTGTEREAEVSP